MRLPDSYFALESELERQLRDTPWLSSHNLAEIWRIDVVVGKLEIHVVENIEKLCAKLHIHSLVDGDVLDRGEIPSLKCWALQGVAANVAELPDLRVLERIGVEPALRRAHSRSTGTCPGIGISHNVWTAAKESRDFRGRSL